jgi:hypothetical protein
MGRRLRAGRLGVETRASHPRWPHIVSAAPNGVHPAARPIPPGGGVDAHCGDEVVGWAGSGFRVDTARHRQVQAKIAGMAVKWDAPVHAAPTVALDRRHRFDVFRVYVLPSTSDIHPFACLWSITFLLLEATSQHVP